MNPVPRLRPAAAAVLLAVLSLPGAAAGDADPRWFAASGDCMACHNGLSGPGGRDVSIGTAWRGTMMAHAARDPYWQGTVRRESLDHPGAAAAIEQECSTCHLPMDHHTARLQGGPAGVFARLPSAGGADPEGLAADGVSCTTCHQVLAEGLGTPGTFGGRFPMDAATPPGRRAVHGPFAVDAGRTALMRSSSRFEPREGAQIRDPALCATCHTLYTHPLGEGSEGAGAFPEQVPYLEWLHGGHREGGGCVACHMPAVAGAVAVSSAWGQPREGVREHVFQGGNFLVPRLLDRLRGDLQVVAEPPELEVGARRTLEHLQRESARLSVEARRDGAVLEAAVTVRNLAGHKLPTAYPSRRAWIHLRVQDGAGRTVFESGRPLPDGSIEGNDNDRDPGAFEAHHRVIEDPGQVQVYEPVLGDARGRVTTGLLQAVRYLKDNRLLPDGFDKASAGPDIAVHGDAREDPDFLGGGDVVRYRVALDGAAGPVTVAADLRYQPVGYRWAANLAAVDAAEPRRFGAAWRAAAPESSAVLAGATVTVPGTATTVPEAPSNPR